MDTERLKAALAILLLCCAAALKLTFPEKAEDIKRAGTELIGSADNYREYVVRIGARLGDADIGGGIVQVFAQLEDGLCALTENVK